MSDPNPPATPPTPTSTDPQPAGPLPPLTNAPVTVPSGRPGNTPYPTPGSVSDDGSADHFDAANRSLADALSVSFRLLRVLMLVLLVVFLLSGFFTVQQNEVAVRTTFGRITTGADGTEVLTAEGGPYFRWPAPVGMVYRIPTTRQALNLDDSFVFAIQPQQAGLPLAELSGGTQLEPDRDGSLLTGDKNLVHARYSVTFRIRPEDAADFVRSLASVERLERSTDDDRLIFAHASRLIRFAVEAAVVQEVATTRIDDFARGISVRPDTPDAAAGPDPATESDLAPEDDPQDDLPDLDGPVDDADAVPAAPARELAADTPADAQLREDQIRVAAQQTLDNLRSGVTIEEVLRTDQSVPVVVRNAFEEVTTALQQRSQLVNEGASERTRVFTRSAGRGFEAVVAVVDTYEAADRLREQNPDWFESAGEAMMAMFDGEPVGAVLESMARALPATLPDAESRRQELLRLASRHGGDVLGGNAVGLLTQARGDANQIEQQTRAEAQLFNALLARYQSSPDVVRAELYLNMWRDILSNPAADVEFLPRNLRHLMLDLNEDPAARRGRDTREAEERDRQREEARFRRFDG